jgi:GxxExxY protein
MKESRMPLQISSTLPVETEEIISRIIGCALAVHRELGPGFLERIYSTALCLELDADGLSFEREKAVTVTYRGIAIPGQRMDLIVAGTVIVEVKAVAHFDPVFQAKLMSYLKTTGLRAGLLINFNRTLLREGIKRVVL